MTPHPAAHTPGTHAHAVRLVGVRALCIRVLGGWALGARVLCGWALGALALGVHASCARALGILMPGTHTLRARARRAWASGARALRVPALGGWALGALALGVQALRTRAPGALAPGVQALRTRAPGALAPGAHALRTRTRTRTRTRRASAFGARALGVRTPGVPLLVGCVLSVVGVPVLAGCSGGAARQAGGGAPSEAATTAAAGPATAGPVTVLTPAQAAAALLTEADLGGPWQPTQGAATWRDGILKARTTDTGCQRLLDALYADEPLGSPTATHAVTAFDDPDDAAQLRQQVLALKAADVDRALAWLRTLPRACSRFTAATTGAGTQEVTVEELPLPAVGDARQGLRVVFTGQSPQGDTNALAVEIAAVRVGDDAITVTDGALGSLPADATAQAARLAAGRLTTVRQQARAQA
ncbi:hypothetical protein [Streptomyces naganishii]|uniref:Uncharacterized protein n=1 Tax=Streptomyces naganishii JCM 4654 TaxID=1306179 RepID=A0A918XZA1_9ACTN|nr:hypothetical protein [Streptomyces naganishii]GHD85413.1 hypothetical protein GCM10010508_09080 [Streptomyces naganishii JCM 4654]